MAIETLAVYIVEISPMLGWAMKHVATQAIAIPHRAEICDLESLPHCLASHAGPTLLITGPSCASHVMASQVSSLAARNAHMQWLAMGATEADDDVKGLCLSCAHGHIGANATPVTLARAITYLCAGVSWFYEGSPPQKGWSIPTKIKPFTAIHNAQSSLTARQSAIYALAVRGLSNKFVAAELQIAESTVKEHMTHILNKLGLTTRLQMIAQHRDADYA
jgi:DNA-binding NarL/FixJ family response regulator